MNLIAALTLAAEIARAAPVVIDTVESIITAPKSGEAKRDLARAMLRAGHIAMGGKGEDFDAVWDIVSDVITALVAMWNASGRWRSAG